MEINTQENDGVNIVSLVGDLDTTSSPSLEACLKELQENGAKKILLNLENLRYTSSAGLRVLLLTAKTLKKSGGAFAVYSLNDTVQEVFDISGFATILNVGKTEEDALKLL